MPLARCPPIGLGVRASTSLDPNPHQGYSWVEGRLTRVQKTTRPDSVWPEVWRTLSRKEKAKAIKAFRVESQRRETQRAKGGIYFVPDEEIQKYNNLLAKVRNELSVPAAPAMPVVKQLCNNEGNAGGANRKQGSLRGSKRQDPGTLTRSKLQKGRKTMPKWLVFKSGEKT